MCCVSPLCRVSCLWAEVPYDSQRSGKGERSASQLDERGGVTRKVQKKISLSGSEMGGLSIPDGPSATESPFDSLQGGSPPREAVLRSLQRNILCGACLASLFRTCTNPKNGRPDFYHHIFKFSRPVPKHVKLPLKP